MSATTVTGVTVEQVSSKVVNTKYGSKNTYAFKANGQWYKTGFKNSGVKAGDVVSFEFSPGTYGNEVVDGSIGKSTATTPGSAAAPAAPEAPAPRPSGGRGPAAFPIPALDGQRAIVRQNALTNARELIASSQPKGFDVSEELTDLIISVARKFEAYSCGDADLEMAKAAVEASPLPN